MRVCMYASMYACMCVCGEGAAQFPVRELSVCGVAMRQLYVQPDSPVLLGAVAAPGNELRPAGMRVLRLALEELGNLSVLSLSCTCGDVQ